MSYSEFSLNRNEIGTLDLAMAGIVLVGNRVINRSRGSCVEQKRQAMNGSERIVQRGGVWVGRSIGGILLPMNVLSTQKHKSITVCVCVNQEQPITGTQGLLLNMAKYLVFVWSFSCVYKRLATPSVLKLCAKP